MKVLFMSMPTSWFTRAALAGAIVLFANTQPVFAQRGGGGHGGGWGGGSWGGGGRGYGGWGYGGRGYGYGYGGWYGGYFADDPFLYGPYYYGGMPYYYPPPPPGPPAPYYPPAPIIPNYDQGPEKLGAPRATSESPAMIEVRVLPDAEIWFDGNKTSQRGSERLFKTPPLTAGKTFNYEVRASWTVNGTPTTKTQMVQIEAGKRSVVNFIDAGPGT
jgi:uncharacterized protein (TIGR03000 family)